jgi:hypothetical protein
MTIVKKNALTIVIGILAILTSVFVFFSLSYPKAQIDYLAFYTVLIAEMFTMTGFIVFNKLSNISSKVLISAGAYTALFLYILATVAITIFYLVYFRYASDTYLAVEVILFAVLLIFLIVLYSSGKVISKEDDETLGQITMIKTVQGNMSLLRDNPENNMYRSQLSTVYEALVNCDQSVFIKTDAIIDEKIHDLSMLLQSGEVSENKVTLSVHSILQLINERAFEVRRLKEGGI